MSDEIINLKVMVANLDLSINSKEKLYNQISKISYLTQQKENIIKEVRNMLYKRDLDSYDTYTANVVLDIQSDFEEILRGEY